MNEKLVFGIYPGGAVGSDSSNNLIMGKPNEPLLINHALDQLHTSTNTFLVRSYIGYIGDSRIKNIVPENPIQYLNSNRKLDLVLCYQPQVADMSDWKKFVRQQIGVYGSHLVKIQITEEPNLHNIPAVDGDSPEVRQAVIQGVIAAKKEILQKGLDIQVGFNAVPTFDPTNDFWREIGQLGTPEFFNSLDYVGLDFFPDVFRPIAFEELGNAVETVLNHFRNTSLAEARIPGHVPMHITENGWPTAPERSEFRQAEVLEKILSTIFELRKKYNITHYELFDLRDADSKNPYFFNQFGIMRDDYSPKPAFEVFRKLISEFS